MKEMLIQHHISNIKTASKYKIIDTHKKTEKALFFMIIRKNIRA